MSLKKIVLAAQGKILADTVLKNALILNVFTEEWEEGDIAILGTKIVGVGTYSGKTEIDLQKRAVVPGFINTHVHMESTMVTPPQLAAEIVPWGTTTIIADPHEVANVKGLAGIDFLLRQTESLLCSVYFMMPSCVPALPNEESGAVLTAQDLLRFAHRERVLGLGEVMNFPDVVAAEENILKKIAAFSHLYIDGHAPNLVGNELQAYRAAGIFTDHECSTEEEVIEKLKCGMYILAREGSSAKNVRIILQAIQKIGGHYERVAFCTDDKHIFDIRKKGEIAENIRIAVEMGIPAQKAYKMASFNGAQIYGLRHLGAICASMQADLVVLDDVNQVRIHSVYKNGKKVSEGTKPLEPKMIPIPKSMLNTVHCKSFTLQDIQLKCGNDALELKKTPVIQVIDNQILTKKINTKVPHKNGFFVPNNQFNKLIAVERHHKTGHIGVGIVTGLNINGAIAASISHDSHNIICAGSNDDDIFLAVQRVIEMQGGFVCAQNNSVIGSMQLSVCGLMTNEQTDIVLSTIEHLKQTAHSMGVPKTHDPFITLSFLALPVIPQIRITTHGVVEC